VAAIFEHHAFALKAQLALLEHGYHADDMDVFPSCAWPVHPLKLDFVRQNLMPSLRRIAREQLGPEAQLQPMLATDSSTIFFVGDGITGRTDARHHALIQCHRALHRFIQDVSLQRVELTELRDKHREVLQLKLDKLMQERARRVRSMALHGVGDEASSETNVQYRTSSKESVRLIRQLDEIHSFLLDRAAVFMTSSLNHPYCDP
jgi:hypothetical protein